MIALFTRQRVLLTKESDHHVMGEYDFDTLQLVHLKGRIDMLTALFVAGFVEDVAILQERLERFVSPFRLFLRHFSRYR